MRPVLIDPPSGIVVPLSELRTQCRADENTEEDNYLTALQAAAVAHLDGWYGILGRCIQAQGWQQDVDGVGPVRLALPDIQDVTVFTLDAQGVETPFEQFSLATDPIGTWVMPRAWRGGRMRIKFTAEMPQSLLPVVQQAIKLLVGHWYANREAVTADNVRALPFAVDALLSSLRWTRVG